MGRVFRGPFLIFSLVFLLGALTHSLESNYQIICLQNIEEDNNTLKYTPSYLCTHIVYQTIQVDAENDELCFRDSWNEFNRKYGKQVAAYKDKGIKVSVQVDGLDDSIVRNVTRRATFVKNSIIFLHNHKLDGLQIRWKPSHADSQIAYGKFVPELSHSYKPLGLYLSIVFTGDTINNIDNGYHFAALADATDWISIDLVSVRDIHATGINRKYT